MEGDSDGLDPVTPVGCCGTRQERFDERHCFVVGAGVERRKLLWR